MIDEKRIAEIVELLNGTCPADGKRTCNMCGMAVKLIESLHAQPDEITEKPELTSPVKYYTDGKPYLQIGGLELHDHPVVEACARLDRYEKYIIPHLRAQLAESRRREAAAIRDLRDHAHRSCYVCGSWVNGRCIREPKDCAGFNWWQWRGPQEAGEAHER